MSVRCLKGEKGKKKEDFDNHIFFPLKYYFTTKIKVCHKHRTTQIKMIQIHAKKRKPNPDWRP